MLFRYRNPRYEILFFLSRFLLTKPLEQSENFPIFRADTEGYTVLDSTTNNVVAFRQNGVSFFFRECRMHSDRKTYVRETVSRFFALPSQKENAALCQTVLRALDDKKAFYRFFFMGFENDTSSPLAYFQKTGDASAIGLGEFSEQYPSLLQELARYAWGELIAYRLNAGLRLGSFQTFHASRNLATYRIASLFFPSLVPETRFAFLITPRGEKRFGTVMNASDGINPCHNMPDGVTDSFQKELLALHSLDILTHERDHRPGNFFVRTKENQANSVSAIDNDAPMTFFPSGSIAFSSYLGCSPLVKNKKINRPHFDSDLKDALVSLSDKKLRGVLHDILTPVQIAAVLQRKRKLLAAIKKSESDNPDFLLSGSEWNLSTRKEECSGQYGKTYLSLFLQQYILHGGQS